jgi:hypothetical protein
MATNIPKYTGEMPDLASQGQEEISQNMTNFANYINALPTPLNTLADELTATNAIAAQQEANASKSAADALKYRNEAEVFAGLQNFKGDYLAGSYDIGDSVYYQGAYFINGIASNTNDPVSGGWSIIPKADFEPSVKPILDLDFANQEYSEWEAPTGKTNKLLANILDVTRSSNAGYTDPTGMGRTVADDTARLTYDAETGVSEGLLLEEARTNLALYSESFDTSSWSKLGVIPVSVSPNTLTAPNGTLTADTATYSGDDQLRQDIIVTADTSPYTFSIWLSGSVGETITIDLRSTDSLLTAQKQVVLTSNLIRYTTTLQNDGSKTALRFGVRKNSADTASVVNMWGAQLEQGSYPTSYIPTTTTQVTRAADIFVRDLDTLDAWNDREGTLYGEYRYTSTSQFGAVNNTIKLSDGTGDNKIQLWNFINNNAINLYIIQNGVQLHTSMFYSLDETEFKKVVVSWKGSDAVFSVAGQSTAFTLTEEFNAMLSELLIGGDEAILIKGIKLFPRALSEAECLALTS